ncbi:MAG: hypothetical protein M0P95_13880 [Sulfuritalea sp.]|nr:hypothetical protein [Sulfuritalea sp.]
MKAIFNGKTYDTDTATSLAILEQTGYDKESLKSVLYVNRRGAFFEWTNAEFDQSYDRPLSTAEKIAGRVVARQAFGPQGGWRKGPERVTPLTLEHATMWAEKKGARLTDDYSRHLGELPPEAGEEEVAITVRLTVALKAQIERKARAVDMSVNSWIVQQLGASSKAE